MSGDEVLRSLQNPQVKQLVRLKRRPERRRTGLTRIDGGRELLRALQAGWIPQRLYLCPERLDGPDVEAAVRAARQAGTPVQEISAEVAERIRYGERDEGLCAVLSWRARSLDELRERDDLDFLLVVDGGEKPGNLGALLRTADGAGVDAVLFVDPACELSNPNVIRSSMGTLFTQSVHEAEGDAARQWLAASGLQLVITRPEAARPYHALDLRRPVAIVLGAEHAGLSSAWDGLDAEAVHLPMHGLADSLNLSASAAIMLYEVVRQRTRE